MKVQSKFGNDPRFKLDQRFIDEDELTEVPASENTQQGQYYLFSPQK